MIDEATAKQWAQDAAAAIRDACRGAWSHSVAGRLELVAIRRGPELVAEIRSSFSAVDLNELQAHILVLRGTAPAWRGDTSPWAKDIADDLEARAAALNTAATQLHGIMEFGRNAHP